MNLSNSEWHFYVQLRSSWYIIPTIVLRYKRKHYWDLDYATPAFFFEIMWLRIVIGFQVQEKLNKSK